MALEVRQDGVMDAQDIADDALLAEPAVEDEDKAAESVTTPPQGRAVWSDTDDGVSSAVAEADFEASVGYLRSLTGGRDPLSADGLKAMRVAASSGSSKCQEVSKLIKALVRATAKVQSFVGPVFSDSPSHSAANNNYSTIIIDSDGSDISEEPLIRRRTTTVSAVHGLAPLQSCVDSGRGLFDGLEGEVGVGFGEEVDIGRDGRGDEDHTGDYSVYSGSGNAADKSGSDNGSVSDNGSDDDGDDNM
ncbi:hypothetical protein KI688_004734 [Linnemannia hyalina]|uniref:Uncharacterized protein n=1 Tax=Linnemannia hyalina TaxID=64524 RepID=A0A9P7XNH4_9FUNG|nr:hypothetical protein KI688_004734 [Linnemannia hyalina]